jgi:uncharacterized membrane protein YdjX (TVP38/TMEM64 family)
MTLKIRTLGLILLSLLLLAGQVAAQSAPANQKATLADWEARFGALMITIIFVLVVDVILLLPVVRKLRSQG